MPANPIEHPGIQGMMTAGKHSITPTAAEFHRAILARGDRWYSACLRITHDKQLAEDAVQDALLNAWRMREQFQASAKLDTWIHRIAINSALQLLRKQRPDRLSPVDTETLVSDETPESKVVESELFAGLAQAMISLSEAERVCFVLKHLEQWRLKEIAAELDMTIGTVKQALFRAVRKMRSTMPDLRRQQC